MIASDPNNEIAEQNKTRMNKVIFIINEVQYSYGLLN